MCGCFSSIFATVVPAVLTPKKYYVIIMFVHVISHMYIKHQKNEQKKKTKKKEKDVS